MFHSAKQHGNPPAPAEPGLSPSALVLHDPGRRFACTYPKTLRTSCVLRRVFLRRTTHPPTRSLRAQRRCRRELPDTSEGHPGTSEEPRECPPDKGESRLGYRTPRRHCACFLCLDGWRALPDSVSWRRNNLPDTTKQWLPPSRHPQLLSGHELQNRDPSLRERLCPLRPSAPDSRTAIPGPPWLWPPAATPRTIEPFAPPPQEKPPYVSYHREA